MNMDYCLSELKALLSIDSPSGFTDKAADYLIGELTALGYAPAFSAASAARAARLC